MEKDRHVDLRVQKTTEAIKETYCEMVLEMDADRITVKELTDRARIHRKTFYLHYSCIEALAEDVIGDLANSYFGRIDAIDPGMPIDETNRVFFEFMEGGREGELLRRLALVPSYRAFSNKLFAATLQHNRARHNPYAALPPERQAIVNVFLTQSTQDMYLRWVEDGRLIPMDEMIELSTALLARGAAQFRDDAYQGL